jgi:hypothetical protein
MAPLVLMSNKCPSGILLVYILLSRETLLLDNANIVLLFG